MREEKEKRKKKKEDRTNPFEWQVNSDFLDIISFLDLFLFFYFVTEVKCTKLIIAHVHFDDKFPSHSCPPVNKYSVIRGQDSHQFRTLLPICEFKQYRYI